MALAARSAAVFNSSPSSGRSAMPSRPAMVDLETSFAGGDTVMEMTFYDYAGGTRVQVRQRCRSPEEREGARRGSEVLRAACADFVART